MTSVQLQPTYLNEYLDKAKNMAEDISMPEKKFFKDSNYKPYYQTPCDYYYYGSGPGYWRQRVDHYYHKEGSSLKREKEGIALSVGIGLTALSGVLLYHLGAEYSKLKNSVQDLKNAQFNQKMAKMDISNGPISEQRAEHFEYICNLQNEILNTYKTDSETNLMIKTSVTSGALMGAVAAFKAWMQSEYISTAAPILIYGGMSLMIGGGLVWALKSGIDSTSQTVKRKAEELFVAVQNFQQNVEYPKIS